MSAAACPGPLDEVGRFRPHGVVPTLSRTPGEVTHAGPPRAEHDVAVYLELGRPAEDIASLEREDVV